MSTEIDPYGPSKVLVEQHCFTVEALVVGSGCRGVIYIYIETYTHMYVCTIVDIYIYVCVCVYVYVICICTDIGTREQYCHHLQVLPTPTVEARKLEHQHPHGLKVKYRGSQH